jgi:hypothetical protein
VAGVGIERDVGNDAEFGELALEARHHGRHQAGRIPGFFRTGGLATAVDHRK